jgi:hypothetical protein
MPDGTDVVTAIGGPAALGGFVAGGLVAWLAGFQPESLAPSVAAGALIGAGIGFVRKELEEKQRREEARRSFESIQKMSESETQRAIDSSPFLQEAVPDMKKTIREQVARDRRLQK